MWDRKEKKDTCWSAFLEYDCKFDPYQGYICVWYPSGSYDYYYYEPDYNVYRVVDGIDKLITTIKGYTERKGWDQVLWDQFTGNSININQGQLALHDFDSVLRPKNSRLQYKVFATTARTKGCGDTQTWTSIINVDNDGNGDPDFVPWEVLHRNTIKVLVPILNLILED